MDECSLLVWRTHVDYTGNQFPCRTGLATGHPSTWAAISYQSNS